MGLSIGLGLWLGIANGSGGGAAPVYDPSTLSLTGWWRAPYAGVDWAGTASAGASGNADHDLEADGGGGASVGAALNGHDRADFNGTTQALSDTDNTADAYLSAAAYTISLLVTPRSASAPAAGIYDNEQLVADNGAAFGIAWSTSGVAAWHSDGAYKATDWVACSADEEHRIDVTFGAGTLSIRVDGGEPATVAAGNVSGLGLVNLRVGRNYGTVYTSMLLADLMIAGTALATEDLDSVRASYDADRYGL